MDNDRGREPTWSAIFLGAALGLAAVIASGYLLMWAATR